MPTHPVRKPLFSALKFGDHERLRHLACPRSGPPRFYITRQPLAAPVIPLLSSGMRQHFLLACSMSLHRSSGAGERALKLTMASYDEWILMLLWRVSEDGSPHPLSIPISSMGDQSQMWRTKSKLSYPCVVSLSARNIERCLCPSYVRMLYIVSQPQTLRTDQTLLKVISTLPKLSCER